MPIGSAVLGPRADRGIYPDLQDRVHVALPTWLAGEPLDVVTNGAERPGFVYLSGQAVAFAGKGASAMIHVRSFGPQDADQDGIPDGLDLLIGGKKVVLAAAPYVETYHQLPYPNGDVPRDEGVCTDVIVRALRNAGFDLQQLVHEDALANPAAYPGIKRPNPSIDHRRVRNLVQYFERHWQRLPADPRDATVPWLPADVVFLDTLRDPQPDHVGLVSDRCGSSGSPLIINSWTNGYVSAEMDLLGSIPVTHRYRVPAPKLEVDAASRDIDGLLKRAQLKLAADHRQVVSVITPSWSSSAGTLRRWSRDPAGAWRPVGATVPVRLGAAGMAPGRGLMLPTGYAAPMPPQKREGDRRSPAGVFALGTAFGSSLEHSLLAARWPVRQVDRQDVWVDDPASSAYNTWQQQGATHPWRSAEELRTYQLAVVIRHNDAPIVRGAGSAIFLHSWNLKTATTGCTGIRLEHLREILDWLDPNASPLLVQMPGWLWD